MSNGTHALENRLSLGNTHGTIRSIPLCPVDPDQPHRDRWMMGPYQGIVGENSRPVSSRMVRSFSNGRYQHIMALGVCGYVICNHCDREIVLVDPWPTYHSEWTGLIPLRRSRPLTNEARDAKSRIAGLATFLRYAVHQGFALSGILLSHMHFDHADDVALLLELLAARCVDTQGGYFRDLAFGPYRNHRGLDFTLGGPAVPIDSLPTIYCDYDTLVYLRTYGFYQSYARLPIGHNFPPSAETGQPLSGADYWLGNPGLKDALDQYEVYRRNHNHWINSPIESWREVIQRYTRTDLSQVQCNADWYEVTKENRRLYFDDTFNAHTRQDQRCLAGRSGDFLLVGCFVVQPYIWDHMNTGANKRIRSARADQSSGHLQRMTAFLVSHGGTHVTGAKRTLFIGSMGEMSSRYTEAIANPVVDIETDVLIHAVVRIHPSVLWYDLERQDCLDCLIRHIRVRDAIIFNHFEEFISEAADAAAYCADLEETFHYEYYGSEENNPDRRQLVVHNLVAEIREKARSVSDRGACFERIIDRNHIYVMKRRGFETDYPFSPEDFREEINDYR